MPPFPASLPVCSPTLLLATQPSAQLLSPSAQQIRDAVAEVLAAGAPTNVSGVKVAMVRPADAGKTAVRLDLDVVTTSARVYQTASSSARHT